MVGILAEQADGWVAFRISDTYLNLPHRPVLSQSFEDDLGRIYWGRKPGDLPAYFSNLLPEGRFRRVVEKSLDTRSEGDLGLLAVLGSDLPGAVVLTEANDTASMDRSFIDKEEDTPGHEQLAFRFSLAGVQLKFSMVAEAGKLVIPAHGRAGDWLVKLGTPEYPALAENEFSMLEWARASGFEVPKCALHSLADLNLERYAPTESNAFATSRYDRESERRIHQEDFMQVWGRAADPLGRHKYAATFEALANVCFGLLGESAYEEVVRRIAFIIATGNNDSHLKNWSLLYRDSVRPVLAPLYDQVATVAWASLDRELALKLAGTRDFGRVNLDAFGRLARKVGTNAARTQDLVRETLQSLRASWKNLYAELPLPETHRVALREHWERVPLLRDAGALE
jgi:serine/threonine-protein kinase HipA